MISHISYRKQKKQIKKQNIMKKIIIFCMVVMGLTIKTQASAWETNLTGKIQKMESAGGNIYVLTVPEFIGGPFSFQLSKVDANGVITKIFESTSYSMPNFTLASSTKALVWRDGASEEVKIIDLTNNTVVSSKALSSGLGGSISTYFVRFNVNATNDIIRSVFSGSNAKIQKMDNTLTKTDEKNITTSGTILDMASDFTSSYVLVKGTDNKMSLKKFDGTTETWTKEIPGSIDGASLRLIGDNAYVLSGDNKLTRVKADGTVGPTITLTGSLANSALADINGSTIVVYNSDLTPIDTITKVASDVLRIGNDTYAGTTSLVKNPDTRTGLPDDDNNNNGNNDGNNDGNNPSANEGIYANVSVFPNPVVEVLNIEGLEKPLVEIIDANGNLILSDKTNQIDVSSLSSGIYFCRINHILVKKVMKD
jgi:hypothetical protein